MHVEKKMLIVAMLLIVLSMTFATQYATTKVGYSFGIVHPSEADIRYVGCDNASDGIRLLRIDGDNSSSPTVKLELGNITSNYNTTYSAAFAIVNEELFAVSITHVTVILSDGTGNYLQIWLHGNGSLSAIDDPTNVFVYNNGTSFYNDTSTVWRLARGDANTETMTSNVSSNSAANTNLSTIWDETAHVRYCTDISGNQQSAYSVGTSGRTYNSASDFVWVQISLNVPSSASSETVIGIIQFHYKASTHHGDE